MMNKKMACGTDCPTQHGMRHPDSVKQRSTQSQWPPPSWRSLIDDRSQQRHESRIHGHTVPQLCQLITSILHLSVTIEQEVNVSAKKETHTWCWQSVCCNQRSHTHGLCRGSKTQNLTHTRCRKQTQVRHCTVTSSDWRENVG